MILKDFVKNFIRPNTLIRLLYYYKDGDHKIVLNDWDDISLEWEIVKEKGHYKNYVNNEVIGITDLYIVKGHYKEAINILIEEIENQTYIDETINENVNHSGNI